MSSWKQMRDDEEEVQQCEDPQSTLEEVEAAMRQEATDLQKAFRDRAKKENQRFQDVCDTDYYMTVCFSNRAQMEEFCESVGLDADEIFIDGREFARKIGKALKTPDSQFPKVQAFNRDYVALAREIK